jgi:non-ribosomal peptide synthetase component F
LNFKKLAQLVREVTVSAHSNQDIPFEVLLQTFENETTIRCDTLSPVLFIFQSETQPINLPHVTVSVLDEFQNTATPEVSLTMFDLVLSIKERSEGLTGFLVYKMFVFDEMMVDGFIRNFKNLLERIVYEPNESVSALFSLIEIWLQKWRSTEKASLYRLDWKLKEDVKITMSWKSLDIDPCIMI